MVLRVPQTVNDRKLLEDEPFKTLFSQEMTSGRARRSERKLRPTLFTNLESALREERGGLDASRAWLRTFFNQEPDLGSSDLDIFFGFYWTWYQHKGGSDCRWHLKTFLSNASKQCGLSYRVSLATVIDPTPLPVKRITYEPDLLGSQDLKPPTREHTLGPTTNRPEGDDYDVHDADCEDNSLNPLDVPARSASTPILVNTVTDHANLPYTISSGGMDAKTRGRDASGSKPKKTERKKRKVGKRPAEQVVDATQPPNNPDDLRYPGFDTDASLTALSDCETEPPATRPRKKTSASAPLPARRSLRDTPARKASTHARLALQVAPETAPPRRTRSSKAKVEPMDLLDHAIPAVVDVVSGLPAEKKKGRPRRNRDADTKVVVKSPAPPVTRPTKKRRGNNGAAHTVPPCAADVEPVKASKKRGPKSAKAAAPATSSAQPELGRKAKLDFILNLEEPVIVSAPLPQMQATKQRKGRKRAREDDSVEISATLSVPADPIEPAHVKRPTKPLPKKRGRRPKSAPAPQPAAANGFTMADTILADAGQDGLTYLNSRADPASDWEQDPDDQQPGESSDDEPLSLEDKARKNAEFSVAPPTDALPSVEDSMEQELQLMYPSLMDCPLFDSETHAKDGAQDIVVKPPLTRNPPIWAQSRQEICESFDWFRSYQGGVYFIKDIVKGYLLSAFSASRDLFHNNGRLIISHGGGKAAQSLAKAPGTVLASDQQENDKSVRALLHNYRTRRPLVLIIDDKYALFPFDLASKGCTYAVLGWYQIAHVWAEYQSDASNATGKVVRYKFAFQWCEAQGDPWWCTPGQSSASIPLAPMMSDESGDDKASQVCEQCNHHSPQVYEQGWMCLKPACSAFWKFCDVETAPVSLSYSTAFLRAVPLDIDQPLEDLRPPPPVLQPTQDLITTSRHFCKGWHCQNCGRLSSRYKWEHWECRSCGNTYSVAGRLRKANEFFAVPKGKMDTHKHHPSIIRCQYMRFPSGKSYGTRVTFLLPHNRGRIHALLSSPLLNEQANNILLEYQEQATSGSLKFRRWPLRSHKCRGTLLTNYFSQNTGEPYQYVGGTANTVPFDCAPSAVVHALDLIKQRVKEADIGVPPDFNEVLTAAYMEKQKMAFHSDAERGLGPNVASLSLGAGAYMHFRLHAHYAGELEDSSSREVLTLFLRHGDVIVMEGADIQKYYEHTVVPLNFRIAATARFIGAEHHGL